MAMVHCCGPLWWWKEWRNVLSFTIYQLPLYLVHLPVPCPTATAICVTPSLPLLLVLLVLSQVPHFNGHDLAKQVPHLLCWWCWPGTHHSQQLSFILPASRTHCVSERPHFRADSKDNGHTQIAHHKRKRGGKRLFFILFLTLFIHQWKWRRSSTRKGEERKDWGSKCFASVLTMAHLSFVFAIARWSLREVATFVTANACSKWKGEARAKEDHTVPSPLYTHTVRGWMAGEWIHLCSFLFLFHSRCQVRWHKLPIFLPLSHRAIDVHRWLNEPTNSSSSLVTCHL